MSNYRGTRLNFDSSTEHTSRPSPEVINLVSDSEEEVDFSEPLRFSTASPTPSSPVAENFDNNIPEPRDFTQDSRQYFSRNIVVPMPTVMSLLRRQMSSVHSANR